jgi:hypothetical protein
LVGNDLTVPNEHIIPPDHAGFRGINVRFGLQLKPGAFHSNANAAKFLRLRELTRRSSKYTLRARQHHSADEHTGKLKEFSAG